MTNELHPLDKLYNENKKIQTLSVKDAASRLNLSEPTIYNYIRDGILESVSSLSSNKISITEESVQKFENRNNLSKPIEESAISLNAFSRKMNITKVRLLQIIKSNEIELPKGLYGRREQYVITKEIQDVIHEILKNSDHFPKTQFFNSRLNIALYQAFTSNINHSQYRIEREGETWGIRGPMGLINFEIAQEQFKLVPNYSLRQRIRTSNTTVTFRIPLQHELFYSVIDTIYLTFGMDNLQFKYEDSDLLIYTKAADYKIQSSTDKIQELQEFIVGGFIEFDNFKIKLISYDLTITVPFQLASQFEQRAKQENMSVKQFINKVLRDYLDTSNNNEGM